MKRLLCIGVWLITVTNLTAQIPEAFRESVIVKVENQDREAFLKRFETMQLTGQGLDGATVIDQIPTTELRARLQHVFGDPTQTIADFVGRENVRPGNSIQFEYWFIVDDTYPMMILDIDGPFSAGLVFGGASRYVDLMPQVKRAFSNQLMNAGKLDSFQDYFFSPERDQWYLVQYTDGVFKTDKIERPSQFRDLRLN